MSAPHYRSATRMLGLELTPGKLRGLQRISNPNGTLTMVATDQNNSMIQMIQDANKKKGIDRPATFTEIVDAKIVLASTITKHSSALLVDGYYGVWNSLISLNIPRDVGLLVRVEKSGGKKNAAGAPLGEYEPGFSVGKLKRLGADAVKLLASFEPGEAESAEHQYAFIQDVYAECKKHDILLLLETVAFPYGSEKKDSPEYKKRKAETVLESARQVSRFCDVYKAEFPGHLGQESDAQLLDNLKELNRLSERPWVLLSAGVDFVDYKKQVEMAMGAGASGVLGGRAFWKEYFLKETTEARLHFAQTECTDRVRQIDEIVQKSGTPWYKWYGLTMEEIRTMRAAEGWHFRYGEPFGGKGTSTGAGEWGY
ncbi:MAG: tagatose 1,6-diphosphate aldolase [Gemmataceae bacterium]|nr:tagatose 1,6-diphosphate aldolase [Planctomycetota bacterium]MSR79423.1 tagatose 1,6-diphosphate aldolase [Gemmataceae bacterium]